MQQSSQIKNNQSSQNCIPMSLRVANAMHKLGVVGLPRNYELFYEAISGTNSKLQKSLLDAGTKLDQHSLDEIYGTYLARADDESLINRLCERIETKLSQTMSLVQEEQISVQNYGNILDQASQKLNPNMRLPPEVISRIVGLLSNATETAKSQGRLIADKIEIQSEEFASIKSELEEYKELADTDSLTGLRNRRAFDNVLSKLDKKTLEKSALILGDIDKFKALNDTYGHPFGDMVIRTIAKVLSANAREDVFIARVGGEEFAVFSENTNEEGMNTIAERLRVRVAETLFGDGNTKLPPGTVTISFGVCHASRASDTVDLYAKADEALYAAKRKGRNRTANYRDLAMAPDRKNLLLYKK